MKKEVFRFVQMRNVLNSGIKKEEPKEPSEEGKLPERLPDSRLDLDYVPMADLKRSFEAGHDRAVLDARAYVEVVAKQKELFTAFRMVAENIQKVVAPDPERLEARFKKFMKKNSLSRGLLKERQKEAALAYGSLILLDMQDNALLTAGENAIRGCEIAIRMMSNGVKGSDLRDAAFAQVSVNALGRSNKSDRSAEDGKTGEKFAINTSRKKTRVDFPIAEKTKRREMLVPYQGSFLHLKPQSNVAAFGMPGVPQNVGKPRKVSVGDLILIQEILFSYEFADIAHVENVMQSEHRSRLHQIRQTDEVEDFSETETNETSVNELKSTDQYELEEAMTKAASSTLSASVGTQFSASYGPVSASGQASASGTWTNSESESRAANYAKEVIERAVNEVSKRVKTSRRSTSKTVVIERNRHGFDNRMGQGHIVGIYRYLNRYSKLETINYGKRLMLEFIVPEPATNLIQMLASAPPEGVTLTPPEPFENDAGDALKPEDIEPNTYQDYMNRYDVRDLPAPPEQEIRVPASFVAEGIDKTEYKDDEFGENKTPDKGEPKFSYANGTISISIPTGYFAKEIEMTCAFPVSVESDDYWNKEKVSVACEGTTKKLNNYGSNAHSGTITLENEVEGSLDLGWSASVAKGASVSISVHCEVLDGAMDAWRNAIWQELHTAYLSEQRAFDNQLNFAESTARSFEDSPLANRLTEARELKRAAITMMTDQYFDMFGSIDPAIPHEIDVDEAQVEGEYIRFFEDCLEWSNMTYELYDYAWSGPERWVELLGRSANDTLHKSFLQAGAARIRVPAQIGYEIAVLNYLEDGSIWDGEEEIELSEDHVLYKLVMDMIEEPRDLSETKISETEITVPTNLVMLQAGNDPNDPAAPGPNVTPEPYPTIIENDLETDEPEE